MPDVRVGDLTIHAEVHGDGDPPLLLIPGTGMDSSGWGLNLGWMMEGRRVIAVDNRDSGRSSSSERDYTPRDLARDALGVLKELDALPADVIGYSLGGAAAQELALMEPAAVGRLVLLSTWAGPDPWLDHQFGCWERIALHMPFETIVDLGALALFTPEWFAQPGNVDVYRSLALAGPPRHSPDAMARQWRADRAHDARDRIKDIAAPALVVVGDHDVLVPPRFSDELAALIPGARLEVIAAAGHGAHLEQPDAFREAVQPFLTETV